MPRLLACTTDAMSGCLISHRQVTMPTAAINMRIRKAQSQARPFFERISRANPRMVSVHYDFPRLAAVRRPARFCEPPLNAKLLLHTPLAKTASAGQTLPGRRDRLFSFSDRDGRGSEPQ